MHWVFNTNYLQLSLNSNGNFFVELKSYRNINIEEGDFFLILSKKYDNYFFISWGQITEKKMERRKDPDFPDTFTFTLSEPSELKDYNSLKDLAYSLQKIYYFDEPWINFRRQYSRISKIDFDNVVKGNIYYARTFFGKIIKCLPYEHKLGFISKAISTASDSYIRGENYELALQLLKEYLDQNLFIYGEYLISIHENLKNMIPREDIDEAGFLNDADNKNDKKIIVIQAEIFRSLFSERYQNFWNNIQMYLQETVQEEFKGIFQDQRWPVDLRKRNY